MGSLLATITGHFGKPLVLGTMMPVILALAVFSVVLAPRIGLKPSLSLWEAGVKDGGILDFTIAIVLLTGLLYPMNSQVQRLFEGYPWKSSWIGRWRVARYQAELDDLITRRRNLVSLLQRPGLDPDLASKIRARLARVVERIRFEFPKRSSVLPTHFGNIVRAAENYPRDQYGISSIPAWTRLVAVLPKEYASRMDDGKVALDFFLNCSFLSLVLGMILLFLGTPKPGLGYGPCLSWLGEVGGFVLLSNLFYRFALAPAMEWGALFKGAFDLYRWELLVKLGYQQKPVNRLAERELWKAISAQLLFGDRQEYEESPGPIISNYQ